MGLSLACVTWNQPDEKQFAQKIKTLVLYINFCSS